MEAIEAVADRGYYSGEEILACEEAGIRVYLPKPMTSGINAKGRFGKQDFVYVAADDVYLCPAGERLTYRYTNQEDGKTLRRYWTTACQACGAEEQVHDWQGAPDLALGTRSRPRDRAGAARSQSGQDARASPDCGASLRHDKVVDGIDAFPDENAQARRHRNGAACPGLQHETRDY